MLPEVTAVLSTKAWAGVFRATARGAPAGEEVRFLAGQLGPGPGSPGGRRLRVAGTRLRDQACLLPPFPGPV